MPVSSHLIGRAAYRRGARLWEGTRQDELRRLYPEAAAGEEKEKGGLPPPPS